MAAAHRHRLPVALVALTAITALAVGAIRGDATMVRIPAHPAPSASRPPHITVTTRRAGLAPGFLFVAPKRGMVRAGALIADTSGRPRWFRPAAPKQSITDFRVQTYRGEPALTYWHGRVAGGHGTGSYVVLDENYRRIARVRAGNGLRGDLHEFRLTDRGTALITIYVPVKRRGAYDGVVQEISLKTGKVLFQWHSLDHVPLSESLSSAGTSNGYGDYFHVNSVDLLPDGNFLISARNTSTIYKVSRETGAIMWRLGGTQSDFELGAGAQFNFQHDAQAGPNGTITVFDNGGAPKVEPRSRGLVLSVDETTRTVRLVRAYAAGNTYGGYEGNMQLLPNGNVFVGFGNAGVSSELSPAGRVLFHSRLPARSGTYRAYRSVWRGFPAGRPRVSATRTSGVVTALASWNGATEVHTWRVLAGSSASDLKPAGEGDWSSLTTRLGFRSADRYIAIQGLDAHGEVLGTSEVVRVDG